MLTINLQSSAAVSAFVMSAALACRRTADAKWRSAHPGRKESVDAAYRARQRSARVSTLLIVARLIESDPSYVPETTRICVKCGSEKAVDEFNFRKSGVRRRDCKGCRRVANERFHDINPGWTAGYREKHRAVARASYARKTPQQKVRSTTMRQAWLLRAPEVMRALKLARRALEVNAPGTCSAAQLKARFDFYGGCCAYCGAPAESSDHVIPLSRGGSNWPANIRPACSSCNCRKSAKKLSVWKAEQLTA